MGLSPVKKAIQLDDIDQELKNSLWNALKRNLLDGLEKPEWGAQNSSYRTFALDLWENYFKEQIDEVPLNPFLIEEYIKKYFFEAPWEKVYDFIEFLASPEMDVHYYSDDFREKVNVVLQREVSGYRFVDRLIAPISSQIELDEIDAALQLGYLYTSLQGANIHFETALAKLAHRTQPDYRNSIKEALSAVESTVRIITGASTLGDGLKRLENSGIVIDKQLKDGFEKHYAYSNNKSSGIRHSIIEEHKSPDFEDAKYMLVTCCAFINFLVGKMSKAGLGFNA